MQAEILPLAITMMAGPQILADVVFITSRRGAVKVSLSYLAGIMLAISVYISAFFVVARLFGLQADAGGQPPRWEHAVEIGLIGILIFLSLKTCLTRHAAKPPKWLGQLQDIKPAGAFKLGVALIWLMPGDIIVMSTIGLHLAAHGSDPADLLSILPFLGLVLLLAGFPLISYLAFGERAKTAIPKLRDWMQTNSWLINIIIYLFFIVLITT